MNSTKVLQLQDSYIFSTSGSSGGPRRIARPAADIQREIMYLAENWPARRIVSVVPIHHIYGFLWTVLLGKYLIVDVMHVRGWHPEATATLLREGDLIVAYPGAWSRWANIQWPGGVVGVSSGGGAPDDLGPKLLAKGLDRWTEIYGCTELGAIGLREAGARDYELLPYWPDRMRDHEPPDYLDWVGPRQFQLLGRKDGCVEISGMNVDLALVRRQLLACPGVQEVALRKSGTRLEAMVAGSIELQTMENWAAEHLTTWQRPKRYQIGTAMRVDERGKLLFDLEAGVDV